MKRYIVAVLAAGTMLATAVAEENAGVVTTGAQDKEKGNGRAGEKARFGGMRDRMGGEQGGRRPEGFGMMNPVDMQDAIVSRILNSPEVAERLGLTQEQISTIKASLDELSAEQKKLTSELEASGVEQAKLLTADSVDETALMAAVDKSSKIRGDLAKLRIKRLLIVKKALTVEQIQKVKDLVQERRKMFEERRKTFENRRGGEKPLGGGERKRDKPQSHDAEPAGGSML